LFPKDQVSDYQSLKELLNGTEEKLKCKVLPEWQTVTILVRALQYQFHFKGLLKNNPAMAEN
jgi:hypothetical protein